MILKQRKRPTRNQKEFITSKALLYENWLVERDTPKEIVIVHKKSKRRRTYQKQVN